MKMLLQVLSPLLLSIPAFAQNCADLSGVYIIPDSDLQKICQIDDESLFHTYELNRYLSIPDFFGSYPSIETNVDTSDSILLSIEQKGCDSIRIKTKSTAANYWKGGEREFSIGETYYGHWHSDHLKSWWAASSKWNDTLRMKYYAWPGPWVLMNPYGGMAYGWKKAMKFQWVFSKVEGGLQLKMKGNPFRNDERYLSSLCVLPEFKQ